MLFVDKLFLFQSLKRNKQLFHCSLYFSVFIIDNLWWCISQVFAYSGFPWHAPFKEFFSQWPIEMCYWWMSIICFYDNSLKRVLSEKRFTSKFSDEWNDEKILRGVLTTLWRFCVLNSNRQQNMAESELLSLLERYQNKLLGKGFIHWNEYGFTTAFKTPENTQCKLVLTKVNFGSKFV